MFADYKIDGIVSFCNEKVPFFNRVKDVLIVLTGVITSKIHTKMRAKLGHNINALKYIEYIVQKYRTKNLIRFVVPSRSAILSRLYEFVW